MILHNIFFFPFIYITVFEYVSADYTDDWHIVEALAEEYPFVVALLNSTRDYLCSGATISKRSVLTSGSCVAAKPVYVAAAMAVLSKDLTANLFDVAYTKIHDDYTYVMNNSEPKLTQMHSNIGLIFVIRPALDLFVPAASLGSYFAAELKDVELTSVGFGRRYHEKGDNVFLQHQCYEQTPCANPRWYYCVCGTYVNTEPFHGSDFGEGAPVLFASNVVCVSTGNVLNFTSSHNIFTVIGAYIPWMEKIESMKYTPERFQAVVRTSIAQQSHDQTSVYSFCIFMLIVKCLQLI